MKVKEIGQTQKATDCIIPLINDALEYSALKNRNISGCQGLWLEKGIDNIGAQENILWI